MKAFLVAPEAEEDLQQIWRYLLGEAGLAMANDRLQTGVDRRDSLRPAR